MKTYDKLQKELVKHLDSVGYIDSVSCDCATEQVCEEKRIAIVKLLKELEK